MANLKDKIEYKVEYFESVASKFIVVRLFIYGELLGKIEFNLNEEDMWVTWFIIGVDKAPYFNLTQDDLVKLAKGHLESLGYNVR